MVGCLLLAVFASGARAHEWTDVTGKFKVQAEFIALRGDTVVLERRADGKIVTVPLERFCEADRAYARALANPSPNVSVAAPATGSTNTAEIADVAKPSLGGPDSALRPAASRPSANDTPDARPVPIATDDDADLADRVLTSLKNACYRCHGEDGTSEGGFNYSADLEKIARTIAKPNDVKGSLLLERIKSASDDVMPPIDEEPRLSESEIAEIEQWIRNGSRVPPRKLNRPFITNEQMVVAIARDLQQQPERSRRFIRYFTLTHHYNAGVSDEELQTFRNAFAKLINSLSWNRDLVHPRAVDETKTVYAIDIRQLHWKSDRWQSIESANPYFLKLATPEAESCAELAQTEMPYVRIDWFVFAASKPPLYHTLLNLPDSDSALEDLLRINVEANISQEQAIRAAFNRSGVSQHNRLIEWHKSPYGSYWKSYDFGGSSDQQNLFQHPLGPTGTDSPFQHDGGEMIFTLPNGLQGYLLVDENGVRIDQGPTNIVSDPKRPDRTVTNGVSCMSCHYTGVISKRDEVRGAVMANLPAFSESSDILALYREPRELDQIFAEDGDRFARALSAIGIHSLSRSGEPISTMAARFEQEIDLNQVACEFGLSEQDFRERLLKAETVGRAFSSLLIAGGTIKRDVFKSMFAAATHDLQIASDAIVDGLGGVSPVDFEPMPAEPVRGSSRRTSRPRVAAAADHHEPPAGNPQSVEVATFTDLSWGVKAAAFSPNNRFLLASKPDETLLLLDVANQAILMNLPRQAGLSRTTFCRFSPDGTKCFIGNQSGVIRVMSVSNEGFLREIGQFSGHTNEITAIETDATGKLVISGDQANCARIWEVASCSEVAHIAGFEGAIKAVRFTRDGKVALATDGAVLVHYDIAKRTDTMRRPLASSWASGQAAAISPNADWIAAGDTYDIRVWNIKTGAELPRLTGKEIQWSMEFTPDGKRLLSGGSSVVNLWDPSKGQRLHAQTMAATGYVQVLAVAGSGKIYAASAGNGGTLQVLRVAK